MIASVHGLSCFPNIPDKFVTWGQDITLYEVRNKNESDVKSRLPNVSANFLAIENRYQYARCVQPSYHKQRPIIAVGLGDGKVGISNFCEVMDNSWEYTPRQQRMCLCLAWNEIEPNILAIGHDRHKSDSCITIWDIEKGLPKENSSNFFGVSESANSICWDKTHRVLLAGMNQKQIKIFDLRQNVATLQVMQTKTVYGLGVAPNGNYLSSFFDSVIMLWDLRSLDRPLKHIQSGKNHLQLSWCPTRSSLLSSLQRESPYITLYDIRCVDMESSREVYSVKKQLLPVSNIKYHTSHKKYSLTALSWHNKDFERALLLSETGNILDFRLPLSILTTYSNHKKLPLLLQRPLSAPSTSAQSNSQTPSQLSSSEYASIGSFLNFQVVDHNLLEEDLVDETRERALSDYGLKMDGKRFSGEFHLSPYLKNVWLGLANLYRAEEKLIGLRTALGFSLGHTSQVLMNTSRIESHVLQWPEFINNPNNLVCYRSDQRDKTIKLCGWPFEQDLETFIDHLCENKEFSRAAMIYVFYLRVISACDVLSKAADQSRDPSMFRIAAIALSSFNADRSSSAWSSQRAIANSQIEDPYLRVIFSFLLADNENFDSVLMEEGVSLADRMAFACKYLSESKLSEYIKLLIQKSIELGDLNGLLLTGESQDGISILQAHMDVTGDIQTVALLSINYFHRELFNDKSIQYWVTSYLDCLNSWSFWEKRADLEIKIANLRPASRSTRTVYLSCNFCGKSVSNALQEDARIRSVSSNINKLSSCPSCRKPLPRCALCLLHMGTTLNSALSSDGTAESIGWQSKPFSKWFSWCQTCRHGGHTEHLIQWFKQNSECPVSSCSCRCFDMDDTNLDVIRDFS